MYQSSHRAGWAVAATLALVGGIMLFRTVGASEVSRGADVAVSCGPAQRAVVRQTLNDGTPKVDIDCVQGVPGTAAATYVIDEAGRVVPATVGLEPAMPVARVAAMPVAYQPQIVSAPAVYEPVVQAPRRTAATAAPIRKRTTWQKRALIIGGSAGAGAGVGALVGGKKGALIGAAVGGGGAALVDALKRD